MNETAERNLLFGLLGLQTGLIDQSALVAAFHAWTRDKGRSIADLLAEAGAIDDGDRFLLDGLVARHLKRHDGDVEKSLAAVPIPRSVAEGLAGFGDPEVDATLSQASGSKPTEPKAARPAAATISLGEVPGDARRFRLLRPHARGGLGEVFVALDGELNREVALKQILGHHADEPDRRTRFLIEAEITGGLEHPGIVPVYGLGRNADGRPYYAMRFIRGDTLKEAIAAFHADATLKDDPGKRSLALRKLLRRFVDVCNAIDYAHSRGVIHRDIKPANVIVGRHGETLVIDWGLAKALGKREVGEILDERTLMPSSASGSAETLPGSAIGTPSYMSPEQAAGDLDALGPRSDVYSLGATLYCLLAGKAPFEGQDLGAVLRDVRKGEFPRPREIDASIDPALEAVCLKAMATDAADRYPGCRALADDVERWSADEPVSAYREPLARRARRWAKRNRSAVTAAAAALVAGVVGLSAVAAVQSRSNAALKKANGETRKALEETLAAQKATAEALGQSEESRKQAEAVGNFLVEVFKKPDPSTEGRDVKVADVLDQATAGLSKGFTGSKATEGALLDALGRAYSGLGLFPKAEEAHLKARKVREAALGTSHRDSLASAARQAKSVYDSGRRVEGVAMLEEVLRRQKAALGPDDPDTLETRGNVYCGFASSGRAVEAIPLLQATLAACETRLGVDNGLTLLTRENLASAYYYAGRYDEAIAWNESTWTLRESKLGPDHPDTITSRNNLAVCYWAGGHPGEALAMHESTLKLCESKLGADHPDTLQSRGNLAACYLAAGQVDKAVAMDEVTLKLYESRLGPEHRLTLLCRNNLARAYWIGGRVAEAIALHEATLRLMESKLSPNHPYTLTSRSNLALAYKAAGRVDEAVMMDEVTLKIRESKLGPDHPDALQSRGDLAEDYEWFGRWAEAEALRRDNLARRRKAGNPAILTLAGDLASLGRNLLKQSKWSEAEPISRECLAIRLKAIPDDWRRFNTESLLGGALLGQGKFAEAEPLVVGGYEGMKARESKILADRRFNLAEAGERLVQLYEAWGKPAQAAAWSDRLGLLRLPADVFAH